MDLGLKDRRAIVCASSRGLGRACAVSLARAGCEVVVNGLDPDRCQRAAAEIAEATGARVHAVPGDVTDRSAQEALVAACPAPDILINNAVGPPVRDFYRLDRANMARGLEQNFISAVEMTQRVLDGMVERRFGRVVNITSQAVFTPLPGLELSSGARAGLTAFMAGIARKVAGVNVTINQIAPGSFATDRLAGAHAGMAEMSGESVAEIEARRRAEIPAGRFGDPAEFGEACAFLCSAQAGFIVGQTLLIDGGAAGRTF